MDQFVLVHTLIFNRSQLNYMALKNRILAVKYGQVAVPDKELRYNVYILRMVILYFVFEGGIKLIMLDYEVVSQHCTH